MDRRDKRRGGRSTGAVRRRERKRERERESGESRERITREALQKSVAQKT